MRCCDLSGIVICWKELSLNLRKFQVIRLTVRLHWPPALDSLANWRPRVYRPGLLEFSPPTARCWKKWRSRSRCSSVDFPTEIKRCLNWRHWDGAHVKLCSVPMTEGCFFRFIQRLLLLFPIPIAAAKHSFKQVIWTFKVLNFSC